MALEEYKQKRDFKKTPEPVGGRPSGKKLLFVVQKHQASHLHYDFRLELHGVLKSWAVPKGLSMDPDVRRLAMAVEDHPWDYRNFEGIIPSGYGKGTVMVWDEGWYESAAADVKHDKKSQQHSISAQYWKGAIKFTLHGKKLKGDFAIYKDKRKDDNAWYIQKLDDKYSSKKDITDKNKSVLSGKTLDEIRQNPSREWTSKSEKVISQSKELESRGEQAGMPAVIEPMNCVLIRKPFDDPDWVYELKLDGYRVVAFVDGNDVSLKSRSGLDYTKKFSAVADAFKGNDIHAVIDGEMTVTGADGTPDFDALQAYHGSGPLLYYAFDILWKDGYDLTSLDLLSRKTILDETLPLSDLIEYTEHFTGGTALFEEVEKRGLEGIVAKRRNSVYEPGTRSNDWLKLPTEKRQEFVVGAWVESETSHAFKSLIFGAYQGKKLMYVGHSGAGFSDKQRKTILEKLKDLATRKNPFSNGIDVKGKIHYVKPKLVANFKFATFTAAGKIRKPAIFKGFREDKDPKDVVLEIPLTVSEEKQVIHADEVSEIQVSKKQETTLSEDHPSESNWHFILEQEITNEDAVELDGKKVRLTNIDREIWKGVPKAFLIEYYNTIASAILPHLKDRPQSLHIKNINAGAPGFYIKDMEGHEPDWAKTFTVKRKHAKKGKGGLIHYLVCNDLATLIYMVNLGCVEINPWTSRTGDYLRPDYIIIDLDPSDEDFRKVITVAKAAHKVLQAHKLKAFPKTSGKTGLHIYIPCHGFSFPDARQIAMKICSDIHEKVPDISTTENTISLRGNKVFLDYNQNDEADTVAAPYAARPSASPTVSAPLEWKEVNAKLSPEHFTIHNMAERLKKKGDLFAGVTDQKIARKNSKILRRLLE